MNDNFNLLENLLYVRGEEGLTPSDLKSLLNVSTQESRKLLKELQKEFDNQNRGLQIIEFNDVFKFATREKYKEQIALLVTIIKKQKLSSASIETIGIIAYKQPISKGEINSIRGIASESVVNTLLVKGLIEEAGISEGPGRPILYGISNKFYDYFNIKSLRELPKLEEFNESEGHEDDFDLYASQRED